MTTQKKSSKEELTRKERKQRRTIKLILDAAEVQFRKKGFEGTSMDDISEEALLSKQTLYNYFDSKDNIYLGLGTRAYKILKTSFESVIDLNIKGLEQVKRLGKVFYKYMVEHPLYVKIFRKIHSIMQVSLPEFEMPSSSQNKGLNLYLSDYIFAIQDFLDIWIGQVQRAIDDKSLKHNFDIDKEKEARYIGIMLATLVSGVVDQLPHRKPALVSIGISEEKMMDDIIALISKSLA